MTIRIRLLAMCLIVALLPAVPLTILVQSLLDKSFNVGLSETVEDALQSGLSVSRDRFDEMRDRFRDDVVRTVIVLATPQADSAIVATAFASQGGSRDGIVVATPDSAPSSIPASLAGFRGNATVEGLIQDTAIVGPRTLPDRGDILFYETDRRTLQLAVWDEILFFRQTDPEFLAHADRLIEGRQIFAQLRLARSKLTRSFFFPFIIIYAMSVALALAFALIISERLSDPLRRLVRGSNIVADGDWKHRVEARGAGGETAQLVGAFNSMVTRLDEQKRRLVDVEKMASWREVARHLAHEIKNPLLPIRLTVEEIRDQYQGDDARYREFLDESTRVVGDEVSHLQKLVKSFSSFAKLPALKPMDGSLGTLAHDVARLYPQVTTTIDGTVPEFKFDGDQMRRVMTNLFDNVVSVAGDGADVRMRLMQDNGTVIVTFADNGPGIPADILARVFEPYFTTRADGSGLGLAMLKNIVLMHGGTVDMESEIGRGTTFTMRLPLAGPPDPHDTEEN
jgi:nitrogen fixation/metabolism regulation signal transduction histidine kinase